MCIYKTRIIYNKNYLYLWKSDDNFDCFIVENDEIVCFPTAEDYERFVKVRQWNVDDEDTVIEIISKKELLELQTGNVLLFCKRMLELWNLAIDIKNSFPQKSSLLDDHKFLYDKLFCGNNLESMVSDGCKYTPDFSALERRQLRAIINEMYKFFDGELEK